MGGGFAVTASRCSVIVGDRLQSEGGTYSFFTQNNRTPVRPQIVVWDKFHHIQTGQAEPTLNCGMSGAVFRNGVFVLPDTVPAGVHTRGMIQFSASRLNQTDLFQCYACCFIDQRVPENTNSGNFLLTKEGDPLPATATQQNNVVHAPQLAGGPTTAGIDLAAQWTPLNTDFLYYRKSTASFETLLNSATPMAATVLPKPGATTPNAAGALVPYDDFYGAVRAATNTPIGAFNRAA